MAALTAEMIQKFEAMLDLEFDGQKLPNSSSCQLAGVSDYRYQQMQKADENAKAKAKESRLALFVALDALSPEEMAAYGVYRAEVKASYAAR